jgi:hypothetical protein
MRCLLLFLLISFLSSFTSKADTIVAQDQAKKDSVKYWTQNLRSQFMLNQLSLKNWSSGGESSLSAKSMLNYKLNYKKNGLSFQFEHKADFGLVGFSDKRIEKTDDRMIYNLSLSHKAWEKWLYTSMLTFRSQFANGYKYPNDSTLISSFLAPGYLTASLGFKYEPFEFVSFFISPASGKLTIVQNQELADKGAFGVKKAILDSTGVVIEKGENSLAEFGINLLANFSKELSPSVELASTLILYNNYLDHIPANRWNIDVDWETTVNFNINKFFQTVLFLHFKYDHNTKFPNYGVVNGQEAIISEGPKLQFKESFGIAVSYKI